MFDPREIIRLQEQHCDDSRGTRKGARILRNVGEFARWFPRDEPIICVGAGDGLEVEAWQLLGHEATGIDISPKKARVASKFGVPVLDLDAHGADYRGRNIYCAHTLEHCKDAESLLYSFALNALSTICVIVPIEPDGSRNPSHLSPIRNLSQLHLPERSGWIETLRTERHNDEPEGAIVWNRKR